MKVFFAIETSQPSGASFRLVLGVTIPLALAVAMAHLAKLL
jgi:hypothetical protein